MSVYFVKGKGWRYDFTLNGTRHTETWFKTKKEARKSRSTKKGGDSKPETGDGGTNRHGLLGPRKPQA